MNKVQHPSNNHVLGAPAEWHMRIDVKRRRWPVRLINSYRLWRQHMGVSASFAAAWRVAR
ncbi:hypothetical protein [Rugamonas rubra]|uniref:hypothetical protein n=1 Tax=Rugamonas rubra TaxID=758825 RepID=UPI001113CFFF|nr:hypothetical protein [Rugamonas rubra]